MTDVTSPQLFSEASSVAVVAESFSGTPDQRLRQLMTSLVEHLHDFVKDVQLTDPEWSLAVDFLTRTGQMSSDVRQEFILLSDVLGVSMLVETMNNRADLGGTESTVLGPFHMVESPPREPGTQISGGSGGEPCLVTVQVSDPEGTPLPGATVDVWQANEDGYYDVQQPELQPWRNLRGLFTADDAGKVWFRSIVPRYYPIPTDGPVGELLGATGRHPNRPAHVHFIVAAPGHRTLTTHIFVEGSPYIESDAVFGVKDSLVLDFATVDDPGRAEQVGLANPFRGVHFDAVLQPESRGVDAP